VLFADSTLTASDFTIMRASTGSIVVRYTTGESVATATATLGLDIGLLTTADFTADGVRSVFTEQSDQKDLTDVVLFCQPRLTSQGGAPGPGGKQEKANAAKSATSKREPRAADPKDGSKEGRQQKKAKNINKGKVKAGQAARLQAGKNAATPGAQQKPKEQKDTRPAGGSLFGHILTKARPACVVRPDSDHVAANQQSGAPGAGGHVFSGHGGLVSLVGGCAGAFLVVAAVGFGSYLKKQDAMENPEPPRETEMTPLFGEPQERGATGLGVTYSL